MPELTDEERSAVAYALRHPRGRYVADRASQLSGVPRSTIYDWRRVGVLPTDYPHANPALWSYRDLVMLRLLAWLRQGGMRRELAAEKVDSVRSQLSAGQAIHQIHATTTDIVLAGPTSDELLDDRDNLLPSTDFFRLLATFDLFEPIPELQRRGAGTVWAPDLVTPSDHSMISPWVLAGDPCIEHSRIPTAAIYALRTERSLPTDTIVSLYPGVTAAAVHDVIQMESRLRGLDLAA